MGNLLYIVAIIMIIGWASCILNFAAGVFIPVLLALTVISILIELRKTEA